MRVYIAASALAFALVALPGGALAAPIAIDWTSEFNPPDLLMNNTGAACTSTTVVGPCVSLAYSHDLTSDGFVPGAASDDQLTGGVLELFLRDDQVTDAAGNFKFTLEIDEFTSGAISGETNFQFDFEVGLDSTVLADVLLSLQADGILNVLITQQGGPNSDFIFESSRFTASGTREISQPIATTPEPASMLLLGTGLAGLAARRRLRRRG